MISSHNKLKGRGGGTLLIKYFYWLEGFDFHLACSVTSRWSQHEKWKCLSPKERLISHSQGWKIPLVFLKKNVIHIIKNHTWKILYHNLEVIFTRIIKIRLILTNAFVIEITGLVRLLVKRRRNLKISKAATVAAQNYVYWGETI